MEAEEGITVNRGQHHPDCSNNGLDVDADCCRRVQPIPVTGPHTHPPCCVNCQRFQQLSEKLSGRRPEGEPIPSDFEAAAELQNLATFGATLSIRAEVLRAAQRASDVLRKLPELGYLVKPEAPVDFVALVQAVRGVLG